MRLADFIEREDLSGDLATIADDIGLDVAKRLFENWRGCVIYVSSRIPKSTMVRYLEYELSQGRRLRDIARELGISERYAQILLWRNENQVEQLELFPDFDDKKEDYDES